MGSDYVIPWPINIRQTYLATENRFRKDLKQLLIIVSIQQISAVGKLYG